MENTKNNWMNKNYKIRGKNMSTIKINVSDGFSNRGKMIN